MDCGLEDKDQISLKMKKIDDEKSMFETQKSSLETNNISDKTELIFVLCERMGNSVGLN